MTDPASGFLGKASGFVRNPLGIIGLLIALIYGVATIVAGASPQLTQDQRWVLVVFAAVFPVIVLGAVYRLVTLHHSKLYAPGDWKDERYVFGPQTAELRQRKSESEVRELQAAEPHALPLPRPEVSSSTPTGTPTAIAQTAALAREPRADLESRATLSQRDELLSLVREADDLVFHKLRNEFGGRVYRDVMLAGPGRDIGLDGMIVLDDRSIGVEIKVVRSPKNLLSRVDEGLLLAAAAINSVATRAPEQKFEFLLVLVGESLTVANRERFVERVRERVAATGITATVRLYSLEELRNGEGGESRAA